MKDEIEKLRQRVQELERSAKAWEEDALRFHRDAEYWKYEWSSENAGRKYLKELLKQARHDALIEAAEWFEKDSNYGNPVFVLRKMAEEG